jgi:hypothetical protein
MLATALVLAGASACSRSDKTTDGGSQTGAATTTAVDTQTAATGQAPAGAATAAQDTQDTPAEPRQGVSGYQPMAGDNTSDTAASSAASESAADTVAVGDSAQVGKPGQRLEGSEASPRVGDDSLATQPNSERIRPPEDSGETVGTVTTDSAAVAAAPMARDTTADLGQVDTAASQQTDTLAQTAPDTAVLEAQVDTTTQQQDTWEEASADTAAIQVEADTTTAEPQTEVAVDTETDTATVVGDSAEVEKTGERLEPNQTNAEANADTLAVETERVRPPEDSTELLGNVNAEGAEQDADVHANADVQADGGIEADADVEGVGDASAESVGAARVETAGGMVTGAAAVSAVTREGQRCTVLDPESPEARRDMASSPATLNPCGTGTMTLPRIWTGELR